MFWILLLALVTGCNLIAQIKKRNKHLWQRGWTLISLKISVGSIVLLYPMYCIIVGLARNFCGMLKNKWCIAKCAAYFVKCAPFFALWRVFFAVHSVLWSDCVLVFAAICELFWGVLHFHRVRTVQFICSTPCDVKFTPCTLYLLTMYSEANAPSNM